jgi:beta-N-acetylhexosaminidase
MPAPDLPVVETISRLSLKQKLAQMFLLNFIGYTEVTPSIRALNAKGLLGGIIFFSGSNVQDIEQLRLLTTRIQDLVKESPVGIPYLSTLDQEGGQLTALHRGATVFPGQMALGRAGDTGLTAAYARHAGSELRWAGITTDFAPVLDVSVESRTTGAHIVDNRMISSDPDAVARHGVELVKGIQAQGVMACAKHFPGMRLTERDTHHQADIVDYPLEYLEKEYLPPFRAAVSAGVAAVMTHHGVYRAFDNSPVSLSRAAIGFLRRNMGFEGLVITDDLIMKAIQEEYPGPVACEMAINAGADLIILTGAGEPILDQLVDSVRQGRIQEETINASLGRILAAKNRYALRAPAGKPPDMRAGQRLAMEIARKSVVVEKNGGGLLPLRELAPSARLSVILANPARLVMSDTVNFYDISLKALIEGAGLHPSVKESVMPWHPTEEESLSLSDIGFISDILIFTTVNAYRFTGQLDVLKRIRALRDHGGPAPRIIAVATRSPDDVPLLLPFADAVISTAGITEGQMRVLVETVFGGKGTK